MQKSYKVHDLCRILNRSKSTIYRYLKQGKIKSSKVKGHYRIHVKELEKFRQTNSKKNVIDKATQFISMKDLKKYYSYYKIKKLVENNKLRKINNRYYENLEFDEWKRHSYNVDEDAYYHVDVYIPNGVVCLYSAVVFYDLTTHIPWTVQVAVPRNQRVYNLPQRPSMTPVYFSDKRYKLGVVEKKSKNGFYRIYDLEKTICDFIAYRTKLDVFTFKEVINNYMRHTDRDLRKLRNYSQQLRINNLLNTYLEVLEL